ncbi:MAG: HEAT repeat domain-containing protein [Pegethrix bostrychoides GSE-TBD4-15B]|jgi:HEAT repeat protein|uniref:HEAT repeat domain-containing protein n=1 Tax=Pegethrix bostrychoides GSE-TBD4-15B TaxID=2839662 RepID=A0A951P904_9CYAN|nr:HEAT repeat domain-containing protein [Pegethrix bostrychoides GSE-TBD4-15B]
MSITPESVQALLDSENFGDRLSGVNQLRQLDPAIAFTLIQAVVMDRNVRVRYAAISQISSLGEQNRPAALDLLRRSLKDPEPDVQAAAADSLGALHLTEAYDEMQALYERSPDWLVKFSIVAALGELGDRRAFDLLESALQSDNDLVKTAAIGALGELGDERAVTLLLPYVSDPDWQVRYRVTQALSHFTHAEMAAEIKSALERLSQDEYEPIAQEAKLYLGS